MWFFEFEFCVFLDLVNCCVNRICWNITSKGLACVGQDEVIFLIETLPDETQVPKDILLHINQIYHEAVKGFYYFLYDFVPIIYQRSLFYTMFFHIFFS